MIRLDFPGFSGAESLQSIPWDRWFRQFDDNGLALVVQESTSRGSRSNFNKLVSRGTATARSGSARGTNGRGRTAKQSTGRGATKRSSSAASAAKRSTARAGAKTGGRKKAAGSRTRTAKSGGGSGRTSSARGTTQRGTSRTTRASGRSRSR